EADAFELERVEQAADVHRQRFLAVAGGWRGAPAEAAHVGADDAVALGQRRNQATPGVPVLRPTVEHHDRLAGPRLGDVRAQTVDLDEAVVDTVDCGEL